MYQTLLCLSLITPGQQPCPCQPSPCPGTNVCVRESVVTKVDHVNYSWKCTEFCLGHDSCLRSLLFGRSRDCGECHGDCHVHRKRELVKKICVEEKCEEKCVLRPACQTAPCATAAPGAAAVSLPVTITSPTADDTVSPSATGAGQQIPLPQQ